MYRYEKHTRIKHLSFGLITNQADVRGKIMNGVQITAKEVTTDHGGIGKKIRKKRRKQKVKKKWKRP